MRGHIDVPDMVVAQAFARVVVDEELLAVYSGGEVPVVSSHRSQVEMKGLEGGVAASMEQAVGLDRSMQVLISGKGCAK